LYYAIDTGAQESVKFLVESGANFDHLFETGATPLHFAIKKQEISIALYLIEIGAVVNIWDIEHQQPLHLAVATGSIDLVRSLLNMGAVVNSEGKNKDSPIHIAIDYGHLDIAALLLAKGADFFVNDKYIQCLEPLMPLIAKGSRAIKIDVLVSRTASTISTVPTDFRIGKSSLEYHIDNDGNRDLYLFLGDVAPRDESISSTEEKYPTICLSLQKACKIGNVIIAF
jgi:ankyrin repeat protein